MLISKCLGVNREGHLTIGECDTVSLAKDYGTPLYVMDEETIRTNARSYRDSINRYYNCKGKVLYASKAFCCKEMCRIAREEGLGLDIVSGGELFTALKAGFDPKDIFFHGNNKTRQEIVYALECGVGRFVADNLSELEMLDSLAGELGKKAHILFRIKPGVDAHTHDFIRTGQIDSKFGFALETGEAEEAVARASGMQHLVLRGIHCHIGSQIFEIEPFELAADIMIGFMAKIKQRLGIEFDELNLGGGFGIKYVASHDPIEYDRYL
ncbi:MAG TPA: diaminopimelate decarboxylase, partial [Clostridia bacterium]|nr:diaminopimelate decarboxylase [Clostridia bacterium]